MYALSFWNRNIFSPIGMLYNILLPINWYSSSIAKEVIAKNHEQN